MEPRDPNEIPGSALNDGAPLHPHTQPTPAEPQGQAFTIDQPPLTPEQLAAASQVTVTEPAPAVYLTPAPPMVAEAEPTLAEQYPRLAAYAASADDARKRELADFDEETQQLVGEQMDKVDETDEEHEALKKQTSEAKKKWEAEDAKLHALIRERREGRGKPRQKTLLDYIPTSQDTDPPADPTPAPPQADPTEDLWEQFPLDRMTQFGMTEADIGKLKEGRRVRGFNNCPLSTVGDVARYTAGDPHNPGTGRPLTDFNGIGPQIANRIADNLTAFHGWWAVTGRDEYAREMGVTRGEGNAVEPGPVAVAGGGGGDPGGSDEQHAGEPLLPGGGDLAHHQAAVTAGELHGYSVGTFVAAAMRTDDEPFVEPPGGPDTYALDTPGEGS